MLLMKCQLGLDRRYLYSRSILLEDKHQLVYMFSSLHRLLHLFLEQYHDFMSNQTIHKNILFE